MDLSNYSAHMGGEKPQAEALIVTENPVEESRLGLPPSVLAGMACVIPFIGAIGLGIVERSQRFVVQYAVQALLFWIVAALFFWFTGQIFSGDNLFSRLLQMILVIPVWLIGLALLGALVLMCWKAFQGIDWFLPGLRRPLDQVLDRLCPVQEGEE